jgi:hypothetical protein
MSPKQRRRHVWQRQIVPMLNWIKYECAPRATAPGPWWEPDIHALHLSYEELAEHSDGLDFTTDGQASQRGVLYNRRKDIQSQFGLYFDDSPGGLRFTMLPKLGMLWRYEEEQKRTQSALAKTADMTREAIEASGTQIEAQLFKAVENQYREVEKRAGRLREMTQVLLARPDTSEPPKELPPRRRKKKRP